MEQEGGGGASKAVENTGESGAYIEKRTEKPQRQNISACQWLVK